MNNNNSNKNAHHHNYGNREFSLFVGDLPHDCSDDKLQHLYQSRFKSVKRVQIIRTENGSSRGFGFIRFEELAEFEKALAEGMKIDNTTLRVDTAHGSYKNNRSRYRSFNSIGSNNSHHNHHQYNNSSNLHHQHHHQHHLNQSHHHHQSQNQSHQQHGSQQHQPPNQQGQGNKLLMNDQNVGGQSLSQGHNHQGPHSSGSISTSNTPRSNKAPIHMTGSNGGGGGNGGGSGQANQTSGSQHSHAHQQSNQHQHNQHNSHLNHNIYNSSQPKNSQHHAGTDGRGIKQPGHGQGGDDTTVSMAQNQNKNPTKSSPHQPSPQQTKPASLPPVPTQQNLTQLNNNTLATVSPNTGASVTVAPTTTTTATSLPSSDISHSASAMPNSQLNVNAGQPSLGPDLRGYTHASMMDNPHLMGATEPSVMPPSSVYGHIYPYGPPPPFGYMPPHPQPNPVIPISAVPPAPPNQAPASGVGHQHSLAAAASGNRYTSGHHQPHHPQQAHAAAAAAAVASPDASALNSMTAAGVQGPPTHQAPFYYYYPSPLYFDQTGAAAPPNLYHPQSFHPQFFALPNPAYIPNAHTYTNQHQAQQPIAPQSDASAPLVNQPQQQPQTQSHQQQVNSRTRDIDAPIE